MSRKQRLLCEEELKAEALDLGIDQNKRLVCPFCEASHEQSLLLSRFEQGLYYECFRASCGSKGFVSSMVGSIPPETKDIKYKRFTPKEYVKELIQLPDSVCEDLYNRHELTAEELHKQRIKYNPEENRIYMPVFDYAGRDFGGVAKTLYKNVKSFKTINYFTKETSRLHYPRGDNKEGAIVVVEDILSSIKVRRYINCVAALGHSISIEQIKELRGQTDHLILMLDNDVIHKALTYKKKFGFYFRNFDVVLLSNDPKDLPEEELKEIIYDKSHS